MVSGVMILMMKRGELYQFFFGNADPCLPVSFFSRLTRTLLHGLQVDRPLRLLCTLTRARRGCRVAKASLTTPTLSLSLSLPRVAAAACNADDVRMHDLRSRKLLTLLCFADAAVNCEGAHSNLNEIKSLARTEFFNRTTGRLLNSEISLRSNLV